MARNIILRPKKINEMEKLEQIRERLEKGKLLKGKGLELYLDPYLMFQKHHFDAFKFGYPNGQKKLGSLRYKSGHIRLPLGKELPIFESEFEDGKEYGIVTIDSVVVCPLKEITKKELLNDGFKSKKDMLWQMTEMEGRYYQDLTPDSIVSYYAFKKFESRPNLKKLDNLIEIMSHHF